jgi:hypothetical protein
MAVVPAGCKPKRQRHQQELNGLLFGGWMCAAACNGAETSYLIEKVSTNVLRWRSYLQ